MKWIHPNTIVGSTAVGKKYFRRHKIEEKLWREIRKGNHILLSAPRRLGKSSIMKYIAANPDAHYSCKYQNISSDATAIDFYKRLFELLLIQLKSLQKARERFRRWLQTKGVEEITATGVKIKEKDFDYKSNLLELLSKLKPADVHVVLMLDEFPDVIKNIAAREGIAQAKDILHTLRSLRHDDSFKGHFTLVLAGSVGLDHIVKNVDRLSVINDLYEQNLEALDADEVDGFFEHLLQNASMQVDEACRTYILQRLQQALPYYIQLIIEGCNDILYTDKRTQLTKEDIDRAWSLVLRNHKNFSDWDERLEDYFPNDYPFFWEVLTYCAHHSSLSIQELYNLAIKTGQSTTYKAKIDDVLIKDGYLHQEGNIFTFISPLLQEWWKCRHPYILQQKRSWTLT